MTVSTRSIREKVLEPETAETAKTVLSTVVTSGTGKQAQTGEPTWGKTGTTDNNGDAWFCGAIEEITTCVWVGHADSNEPMLTEYGGNPVDGGTYPAIIFARVVNAYLAVAAAQEAAEESGEDTDVTVDPGAVAPAESAPPESAEPAEPTPPQGNDSPSPAPAPTDAGGAGAISAGRKAG